MLDSYERGLEILTELCDEGGATAKDYAMLATILSGRKQHDVAIEYYQSAIDREYDNIAWRIAQARSLVALKRFRDAEDVLQTCLRIQHTHDEARRLLRDVSIMIDAGDIPPAPKQTSDPEMIEDPTLRPPRS